MNGIANPAVMTSIPKTDKPADIDPEPATAEPKVAVRHLNFHYGARQVLDDISLTVAQNKITALIGPSGCGKSTFLRTLNRMYEIVPHARAEGRIELDGQNLMELDPMEVRRRVGMVFQRSNPFPKSIFDNVAFGLRVNRMVRRGELREAVERSLRRAALWEEVKDSLHDSAYKLSGGQQQRLC